MKQLNWYQIFGNVHIIPDGRTVTPTDDIQTLLHCANIWDKSYTTIGEVIADDDTLFLTLIDNNAIDYLVRSTTFASSIVADEESMEYIGASDYASETLLNNSTWYASIIASSYSSYVLNASVPTMTSDTSPYGVSFASSVNSSDYAYKVFDNNDNTWWRAVNSGNPSKVDYVGYDFGTQAKIVKFSFKGFNYAGRNSYPKNYTLQGSNDNVTWEDIASFSTNNISVSQNTLNANKYRYNRLNTTLWQLGGGNNDVAGIATLQFYGRQPGGVQSWLKAGGITNKKYTTVSEVLSDLTTLATLMSSSDAIDYLVTAKGWATEICSDSNAMADIGMNNYAANTLLADSVWREAICNSTYFASVLNVSVPTMTSNTQPYGEVIYSGYTPSWAEPYQAFDGNTSSTWGYTSGSALQWVGYKFVSPVRIYKFTAGFVGSTTNNQSYSHTFQMSEDGVTWEDASDNFIINENSNNLITQSKVATSVKQYDRYRITGSSSNYGAGYVRNVQFYGRKDI